MTETDLVDSTALVTGVSPGFGRTFQSDIPHCRTTSKIYSFGLAGAARVGNGAGTAAEPVHVGLITRGPVTRSRCSEGAGDHARIAEASRPSYAGQLERVRSISAVSENWAASRHSQHRRQRAVLNAHRLCLLTVGA
jgi:hypothetical protein